MKKVEVGLLNVFDAAQNRILAVADKVYLRGQEGHFAYILTAEVFLFRQGSLPAQQQYAPALSGQLRLTLLPVPALWSVAAARFGHWALPFRSRTAEPTLPLSRGQLPPWVPLHRRRPAHGSRVPAVVVLICPPIDVLQLPAPNFLL